MLDNFDKEKLNEQLKEFLKEKGYCFDSIDLSKVPVMPFDVLGQLTSYFLGYYNVRQANINDTLKSFSTWIAIFVSEVVPVSEADALIDAFAANLKRLIPRVPMIYQSIEKEDLDEDEPMN